MSIKLAKLQLGSVVASLVYGGLCVLVWGGVAMYGNDVLAAEQREVPKHKTAHEMDSQSQHAQGPQAVIAKELEEVGIEEKVGDTVDGSMFFTNQTGVKMQLSAILAQKKPILLSFFYATCPSLCQYVLNAKAEMMKKTGLKAGEDYIALSISFDEHDTVELMQASHERYSSLLGVPAPQQKTNTGSVTTYQTYLAGMTNNADNTPKVADVHRQQIYPGPATPATIDWSRYISEQQWLFLRGDRAAIERIASQLGFLFKRLQGGTEEFAHTAALYIITPQAKVSRYFYGLLYPPFDVKMALLEAKAEQTRTTLDRVLLYCYRYDAESKGYVLYAKNIMKAGALAIVLFLGVFIGMMLRLERKRKQTPAILS